MSETISAYTGDTAEAAIVRALLYPYLNHAAVMVDSGYATAADVDAGMRFGCGFPVGPTELIDTLGASTVVAGLEDIYAKTGESVHAPAEILLAQSTSGDSFAASRASEIPQATLRHEIRRVGVVGTGTMAAGIVEVFAKAGYDVVFIGRSEDKLDGVVAALAKNADRAINKGRLTVEAKEALLARVSGALDREALADVDLVVEAIAEDLDVKTELFADLDRICRDGAILATTTSSLSIADCAAATKRPADVIGMHFFNPAPIMKLVEVVATEDTAPEVDETIKALCQAIGKHPVSCGDRAGFIVNALLFPYLNDAIRFHEETGTSLEEIDAAVKTAGLPMGPFQLLDVVGNDVSLAIQETLVETFGHTSWTPAPMLEKVVAEGKLGRKTKQGFHAY